MFENQIIRVLVYIVGIYVLLASAHQIIVTEILGFDSWLSNALESINITTGILSIGVAIGVGVIVAAALNKRKTLLYSLGALSSFELALALINIWDTVGQGTPALPALAVAAISSTLWSYYRLQNDGLEPKVPRIEEELLDLLNKEDDLDD